jgi:hypothetical protein
VLLVWAPLASLSLVGQEHGRTIPLADIPMDSSSDLRQQRVSGLDSELLAGRFGPQFSRLVLHPQFSLQSIVFLPVALTAHVLFPMSGEAASEFRRLVVDTFPE